LACPWVGKDEFPLPRAAQKRTIAPGHGDEKWEERMAQTLVRYSHADKDPTEVARSLREAHARFLGRYRDVLVTYGPIYRGNGAPAGYLYQTDMPGTVPAAVAEFLAEDPFAGAGLYQSDWVSDWHCGLPHRLPTMPPRPGLAGFFFHGIGKPGITELRNTLAPLHRAYLQPKAASNCLSTGYLTDAGGKTWMGSATVYEFPDRAAFDSFFRDEPFCVNGLYERIDTYGWRRGVLA
jgi:uncharacterized protein YciI